MKVFFSILTTFLLINLSQTVVFGDVTKEIETNLIHADSYHWLSRTRVNGLIDTKKSISFLTQAKVLLGKNKDLKDFEKLNHKINTALDSALVKKNFIKSKFRNFSPLLYTLLGNENVIVKRSSPNSTAMQRSVVGLIDLPIAMPVSLDYPQSLYMLVLANADESAVEEYARTILDSKTNYYPLSPYKLSKFLTQEEMKQLYSNPLPDSLLSKIINNLPGDKLGVIRLSQADKTEKLSYWNAMFSLWDEKKQSRTGFYVAAGVAEIPSPYYWIIAALILLGAPFTKLANTLNKDGRSSPTPYWYSPVVAAFSFITVGMIFIGFSLLPINIQASWKLPENIFWLLAIPTTICVLPTVLVYIGSSKIPKVISILHNSETLACLLFGALLGCYSYLGYIASYRLGILESLQILWLAMFVLIFVSLQIGKSCSEFFISNQKISAVETVISGVSLIIYTLLVLRWDFISLLFASIILLLISYSSNKLAQLMMNISDKINIDPTKKEKIIDPISGNDWLHHTLAKPQFFNIPWNKQFQEAVEFITEDTDEKIEVIFIEADQGCGKTRSATEIANAVSDHYKSLGTEATILFGDCDELTNGVPSVPYEPFAEALADKLGIGRFSNPAERADKLQAGIIGIGLKAAMSATGTGALSSLLDADIDQGKVRKTNTTEMASVICNVLIELSMQRKGKVIFIIDDTQWMDPETFDLLQQLFTVLAAKFDNNELCFIFTSRPVPENNQVKKMLKELEQKNSVNVFYKIDGDLLQSEEMVEGLLDSLRFDFRTIQRLSSYFHGRGIVRPLHIIQTLETLLEKNTIEPYADKYLLIDKNVLKKLPPPSDYEQMLMAQLGECDKKLIDLLQCCAVVGQRFKASVIADIFNLDLLELLDMLKDAEHSNVLRDIVDEDDIYEFCDKRIASCIRHLSVSGTISPDKMSQKVREYHKRYVTIVEEECKASGKTIEELSFKEILSLAEHSSAVHTVWPDKVIRYNCLAAAKTYARGMVKIASQYYQKAFELLELDKSHVSATSKMDLSISYAKCLLDEQGDPDTINKILNNASKITNETTEDIKKEWYVNELRLLQTLTAYRNRNFDKALIESEKILQSLSATLIQKARAGFYHAASLPPQKTEERKTEHIQVLEDTSELLETESLTKEDRKELLRVQSEAANNIGFVFLYGLKKPEEAKGYFQMAIGLNELPEINDQKGIGIAHGGLGDCYSQTGQNDKAEEAYKVNLDISTKSGDNQGICRMSSMLGGLYLKQAESLTYREQETAIRTATKFYESSLAAATNQKNSINILFALAGIIDCIVKCRSFDKIEYIFKEIDTIFEGYSVEDAPEFARDAVKEAFGRLIKIEPNYKSNVTKYTDQLFPM